MTRRRVSTDPFCVMLSDLVSNELNQELRLLEALREAANTRIDAIQLLLSDRRLRTLEFGVPLSSVSEHRRPGRRPPLRSAVLNALKRLSSGSAAGVTRQLQAEGFQVGGATTLRERVSHELSRMRRNGLVARRANGQYEIATGLNEEASSSPPGDRRPTRPPERVGVASFNAGRTRLSIAESAPAPLRS